MPAESIRGTGRAPWRVRLLIVRIWLDRRSAPSVLALSLALAVMGRLLNGGFATPQLSGAEAFLSTTTAAGALAGAALGGLLRTADPVAETRSPRPLTHLRPVTALVIAAACVTLVGVRPDGWDAVAVRAYLLTAVFTTLLWRYAGVLAAAAAFIAYTGACLFAGVPIDADARWWAVLMHSAPTASVGLAVLIVSAIATIVVCFGHAPSNDHHGPRRWRPKRVRLPR